MSDRDPVYTKHMLECIERIEGYCSKKEDFLQSTLVQDAVLRVLQILSESSQRLSDSYKEQSGDIDWRGISGFRNILVHDYLGGIDLDLVWIVIDKELPRLKAVLLSNLDAPT